MTSNDAAGMPLVLYRATVSKLADAASAAPLPEFFVFFEAPRTLRDGTLESLLHWAWRVDVSLLVITCFSELELMEHWALGPVEDGDVRLFEACSDAEHIYYAEPASVQFFVRPETQVRLQAALAVVAERRRTGFTRHAFDEARRLSHRQWIERHAGGVA